MVRIELAPGIQEDFERILDHLRQFEAAVPADRIGEIIMAIDVLETNPLIGRPVGGGRRELVIGRGAHGYVALHEYVDAMATVFILAIRPQGEAGYSHEWTCYPRVGNPSKDTHQGSASRIMRR